MNVHAKIARGQRATDRQPALHAARRRLAARAASTSLHPAIPRVLCPSCGDVMRLIRIDPSAAGKAPAQTTTFECSCGDDYRQTIRERI